MPGAGALDRRITIERLNSAPNGFNEPVGTWSCFTTIWAQRKDVSDGEKLAAGQVGSYRMSRFVIRSSSVAKAITPLDRIAHDGKVWNILGIKETDEGRNRFIELTAVVATG